MPFSLLSADGQSRHEVRDGAPMLVGRAPTCDVPVFDPTVSRRHAELSLAPGGVKVTDLGSANGTFVNGEKITGDRMARGGDVVTFGKVVFKLQDSAPPRAVPPPMAGGPPPPAPAPARRLWRARPPARRSSARSRAGALHSAFRSRSSRRSRSRAPESK